MIFPFCCPNCEKDKWLIRYNSEDKTHDITCVNCGFNRYLEEIFGNKRRKKSEREKKFKPKSKPSTVIVETPSKISDIESETKETITEEQACGTIESKENGYDSETENPPNYT